MLVVTSAFTVSKLQRNRCRSMLTVSVAWSAKKGAEPSSCSYATTFSSTLVNLKYMPVGFSAKASKLHIVYFYNPKSKTSAFPKL
jgi:hypothetical protein